jgi:hypothetical protein
VKRRVALLVLLVSLLPAGAARADVPGGLPPGLLPPRLLTEVGKPVPAPAPYRSGFLLADRDGYDVRVFTSGSAVIVEVLRGKPGNMAASVYLARGIETPHRLRASFGELGEVSMRFRPRRRGERVQSFCHGSQRLARRPGVFVGRFAFEGEDGRLSVSAHRAKGAIVTPAGRCPRRRFSQREIERELEALFEPVAALLATSRDGVASTNLLAFKQKRRLFFLASREENRGRVGIIRFAVAKATHGFGIDETASRASLSPPAPFRGTGRYRAAPDGTTSWSGGLSVNFPGAPRFPLAGADFEVALEAPL